MEQGCIRKATVAPHWLAGTSTFWYRQQDVEGKNAFVFVDAVKAIRRPAFDHAALAKELEYRTDKRVDPTSLPFGCIDLATDASWVRFRFNGQVWQFGLDSVLQPWEGAFEEENLRLLKKEVPSAHSSEVTMVTFVNNTGKKLEMFWIDLNGNAKSYGTICAGSSRGQSTFVGHVWRMVDHTTGKTVAIYSAPAGDDIAVIEPPTEELLPIEDEDEEGDSDSSIKIKKASPELSDEPVKEESGQEDTRNTGLFVRDFNVWISEDGKEEQISNNGSEENRYDRKRILSSPDGKFAVVWQFTPEEDKSVNLVEWAPEDQLQPRLKNIRYLKPGDRVRVDRPRLFDVKRRCEVSTDDNLFKSPFGLSDVGWDKNSEEYRFVYNERGHKRLRMVGINREGQTRAILDETSDTFVDYSSKSYLRVLVDTNELVWASERDGWNHLFLYDLATGSLKNQITKGEWVVNKVEEVDPKTRRIWFRGYGMVAGQDPYYSQLARVDLDGSNFKILTEGDGTHTWKWSPERRYIVDTWSRVDSAPTTNLRDAELGELILELEGNENEYLRTMGWVAPERFAAPGRDGKTLIYGIIVKPSKFDPTKKYPIIEEIYAGPQDFHTAKSFLPVRNLCTWGDESYIFVRSDGMGTNWRSKAFHDVCYKNLKDAGIPDRIAWMKAAAKDRPWMDISRVGIVGGSAGGQNAASALIFHSGFYKAAIADSGCHDNRLDKIWWNEQWMGWPVGKEYAQSSNIAHASRLEGALMLIVGDMDENVDPACTMRFVKALNHADKDYELLFLPGGGHCSGKSSYGMRRQKDFFHRHLQAVESSV
jgi:dipeptidyl-peptidase 4